MLVLFQTYISIHTAGWEALCAPRHKTIRKKKFEALLSYGTNFRMTLANLTSPVR